VKASCLKIKIGSQRQLATLGDLFVEST